jgi:hypothetical protein
LRSGERIEDGAEIEFDKAKVEVVPGVVELEVAVPRLRPAKW